MYKDVWKKFGVKVLIVLCSVLLVGGVAIAAPKLLAAQMSFSLGQVYIQENQGTGLPSGRDMAIASGAALTVENNNTVYAVDSSGNVITDEPKLQIEYLTADSPLLLTKDHRGAYELLLNNNTNITNEMWKAGTHRVGIRQADGSQFFEQYNGWRFFDYKILQKPIGDVTSSANVNLTGNTSKYLDTTNTTVRINGKVIDSTDYTVTKAPKLFNIDNLSQNVITTDDQVLLTAGTHTAYINLRNFQQDDSDLENYLKCTATVTKTLTDSDISEMTVIYHAGTNTADVTITDLQQPLKQGEDFEVTKCETTTLENGKPAVKVTISGNNAYSGEKTSEWIEYTEEPEDVVMLDWTPSDPTLVTKVFDYDDDKNFLSSGYRLKEEVVECVTTSDSRETYYATRNGNRKTFSIVGCSIVDSTSSDANVLKGRTAGWVRMTLKLEDTGEIGYIHYKVKRNIETAGQHISITTDPAGNLDYNGEIQVKTPIIVFNNGGTDISQPLRIESGNSEFDVRYWIRPNDSEQEINKDADKNNPDYNKNTQIAQKYAGAVYIDIIPNESTSGYYGVLKGETQRNETLRYTVKAIPINKAAKLKLARETYSRTTTQAQLLRDCTFTYQGEDGNDYNVSLDDAGTTFTWLFRNIDKNTTVTSDKWNNPEPGNYEVICNATGNYHGSISATFKITQYSIIDGQVATPCDEDDTLTHEYNGFPHQPAPTLIIQNEGGSPTSLTDFEDIEWENSENVTLSDRGAVQTAAKAKVWLVGNDGETPDYEIPFRIEPREIKTDSTSSKVASGLLFAGAAGFEHNGTNYTYEYSGQGGGPIPNRLRYGIIYDHQPHNLILKEGEDYTVDSRTETVGGQQHTVSVLYDSAARQINLEEYPIKVGESYYLKIFPMKNYKAPGKGSNNFVLAGPFSFKKRSLRVNADKISCDFDTSTKTMPFEEWNASTSNDDIVDWIEEHLTVTDSGVTPHQNLYANGDEPDLTISIPNNGNSISQNGIVKYTITAHPNSNYSESITKELKVGRNIADTWVGQTKNGGTEWREFVENEPNLPELTLPGEYSKTGPDTDPYKLNFGGTSGSRVNLYYDRQNGELLTAGGLYPHYEILEYSSADANNVVSISVQGKNGYYGKVTIKINIKKIEFDDENYRIKFTPETLTYNGDYQTAEFVVEHKTGNKNPDGTDIWEPLSDNCYNHDTVKWENNKEANEQWGDDTSHWAHVTIQGASGYSKTLTGDLKILQQPINQGNGVDNLNRSCFSFAEEKNTYTLPEIPYVPHTDIGDGNLINTVDGAWNNVSLYFTPESITYKLGTDDFEFYCTNTEPSLDKIHGQQDDNDRTAPQAGVNWAVIKAKAGGNYKGVVIQRYTVTKVVIQEEYFSVIFTEKWNMFTGDKIHPTLDVVQYPDGDKTKDWKYKLVEGKDYTIEYGDDVFVSSNYQDSAGNGTYVIIRGMGNYDTFGQTGMRANYVIFGQLTKNMNPFVDTSNAYVAYNGYPLNGILSPADEYRATITFNEDLRSMYQSLGLRFEQKRVGYNYGDSTKITDPDTKKTVDTSRSTQITLLIPPSAEGECTVADNSQKSIGQGIVTIVGQSDKKTKGLFSGSVDIPVTITASLSGLTDATPRLWENNNNSSSIAVTGSAINAESMKNALSSALKTIYFGGRILNYGVDYEFSDDSFTPQDWVIGENKKLIIIPSQKAKDEGYLTDSAIISYNLTSNIANATQGVEIKSDYIYDHGNALVSSEWDFKLTVSGEPLRPNYDYTVTIRDAEGNEVPNGKATESGNYTYIIEGKGSYSGRLPQGEFTIHPYDLGKNNDKVQVLLKKPSITYTGSIVLPEVDDVILTIGNNNEKHLNDPDFNDGKNYGVRKGAGEDSIYINWTDTSIADVQKPEVEVYGIGNYTGSVQKSYLIDQKDISSEDITVEDIPRLEYNNNEPLKPYPDVRYIERIANPDGGEDIINILLALRGEEYNADKASSYKNWIQDGIHFTYQYLDDVHTAGEGKRITIRGVGNFKGSREKTYDVDKLKLVNTKLTFLSEEAPVYDGTKHTPAFKISYGNIDILTFMNGNISSNFLSSSNVRYEFKNNDIASTDNAKASVRVWIEGDNDNYEGEITEFFTILPAPLDNHVRFMYRPAGTNADVDLSSYKLSFPFEGVGKPVYPAYADTERELADGEIGMYYNYPNKANNGKFLVPSQDYYNNLTADENGFKIEYKYVEPDTDDTDIREEYRRETPDYAGKVKVTITGRGNYAGSASFWYFIGEDISSDAKISISPTTAVYNSQKQYPTVTITGVDKDKCSIGRYRDEVAVENLITEDDFVNAGTYYIRVEGDPTKGTYATKPETLTYTITPRAFSNNLVIDGFKREYSYTGYEIRPVGISVTDYIDNVKYKLTEDVDYTLTYTNNLNAGTAYINVEGKRNFSGKATANFMITSSTISSGGWNGSNSFLDQGTGEISGATAVSPGNVNMSMDTIDAMYYTGSPVYPKVSIAGMTENVDYTVTFSNNVEVGTAVATIKGIGNNNGTIVKNFRIIAQLSKCTISPIPAQQYTGSEVKPSLTVRCGNSILMEGTDYTVTYSNNINIGTATATIRALNNANYTGSASVRFSIGNDVGGFIISGYAPSYAYTGNAITPGVVVETGSRTLTPGTDYTVSYSNNVNAGTATITVTGTGRYSGTQTANFVIEPKSMQSLTTTDIADRTYTGDAYTPDITVSDGGKVLTKGVDYTVTYTNNTNPGTASILIQGTSSNYSGTKVVSFKISAVAVKGLKASNVKYNSLKLRWTKQGYADGYQLCDSKSKAIKTVKTNSATITGLTAGKTYKYKVRSYIRNADGTRSYGAFSSVLSATTKLRTPTVKVVSNAKGQARISWSKVSGATGYEIYYKKTAGAKYKKLKTVNNANVRVCTVRGMKSGDRAYFRVRAFRKNGSKKVYSSLNPLKVITVK